MFLSLPNLRVRLFTDRALSATLALSLLGCDRAPSPAERAQPYAYREVASGPCAAGFRPRDSTRPSAALLTPAHIAVQIRAPTNYRATVPHPLLVVYAAAGMSVENNERFTGITAQATAVGWLVAFVAHVRPSRPAMLNLAQVPTRVAAQWCVDPHRIYLTGHSDGGTAATAIALQSAPHTIAGIAPSAAGFNAEDFKTFACPTVPIAVMIWHGKDDDLFPGWGRDAAHWWARCGGCKVEHSQRLANGCEQFVECAQPGSVQYCEVPGGHLMWSPQAGPAMLEFFAEHRASAGEK